MERLRPVWMTLGDFTTLKSDTEFSQSIWLTLFGGELISKVFRKLLTLSQQPQNLGCILQSAILQDNTPLVCFKSKRWGVCVCMCVATDFLLWIFLQSFPSYFSVIGFLTEPEVCCWLNWLIKKLSTSVCVCSSIWISRHMLLSLAFLCGFEHRPSCLLILSKCS